MVAPELPRFDSYDAELVEKKNVHDKLWIFRFKLDKKIEFKPGQYVSIFLEGEKPAPFSIVNSPVEKEIVELGVEIIGNVTKKMSEMIIGERVQIKGPFGRFVVGEEKKFCMLAGGIGVTPFISMMRWVRDFETDKSSVLFYSCKTKDHMIWFDELEKMQSEKTKTVFTLTRDVPEGWVYYTKRISEEMLLEELPDYKDYVFYCCGPAQYIETMFHILRKMGVPEQNLKREAWF